MFKFVVAIMSTLLVLSFGLAQNSGGSSGGTKDVGNVADSGLVLITTRDPNPNSEKSAD